MRKKKHRVSYVLVMCKKDLRSMTRERQMRLDMVYLFIVRVLFLMESPQHPVGLINFALDVSFDRKPC